MSDKDLALKARGVSKSFPGTQALTEVDIDVAPGQIHALCGSNGSGKSTLIKILSGVQRGDNGLIESGGQSSEAHQMTPAVAHRMGVRVVHQDLGIFPDLSVAENLFVGHGFDTGAMGRVRWRRVRARATELIERFDIPASPRTPMSLLSRAAQTQVAIARALQDQSDDMRGTLILDEPTASLPAREVELLLGILRRYAAAGQGILYVSHRLDEVLDLSDRVTVLQNGSRIGDWDTAELDQGRLIELIVGRRVDSLGGGVAAVAPSADERPVLEVQGLRTRSLRGIGLNVRRGEIVGLAGLLGSGRTRLLRAIFGDAEVGSGEIRLDGTVVRFGHPAEAMRAGVALVPEDRAREAAFLDQPVTSNLVAATLANYWSRLHLRDGAMRADARLAVQRFGIKTSSVSSPLNTLSGGNQQKVVMARWLRRDPRLLLLDEPTQGVDVGARADIYRIVREATNAGAGALIVVSDLEELASIADRVYVLAGGEVAAELGKSDLSGHHLTEMSYANESGARR